MVVKVFIAGYYGLGNIGDEAILHGIISGLRNYLGDAQFFVLTNNKTITESLHNVSGVEHSFKKGFMRIAINSLAHNEFKNLINNIDNCDIFILGGGALLQDLKIYYLPFWLSMLHYAQMRNKMTAVYGIGAGPIDTDLGKKLCNKVLNRADIVTVRDTISKQVLDRCGVKEVIQTADPAFGMDLSNYNSKYLQPRDTILPEDKTFISTTLYNWLHDSDRYRNLTHATPDLGTRRKIMANIYSDIIDEYGEDILFIPTVDIDEGGYYDIKNLMKNNNAATVAPYNNNINYYLNLFKRSDLLIGARLHSLIFATIMGIPIVPISYCSKVRSYLELLGLTDLYLDIEDMEGETFRNALFENIDEVSVRRSHYRDILINKASELRTISLSTAKIVSELYKEGL